MRLGQRAISGEQPTFYLQGGRRGIEDGKPLHEATSSSVWGGSQAGEVGRGGEGLVSIEKMTELEKVLKIFGTSKIQFCLSSLVKI